MKKTIIFHDINKWAKQLDDIFWNLERLKKGTKVIFDMKNVKFIRPQGAIMFMLLTKKIYEITGNRVELSYLAPDVGLYIERLDFLKYNYISLNKSLWYWKLFKRNDASNTIVEITHVKSPKDTGNFKKRVLEILNTWYPERKSTQFSNMVATMVEEICNNSIEHSTGNPDVFGECFCTLQKYTSSGKPKIVIAIGDTGIGIKQHLNLKHKSWLHGTDAAYIKKVLSGLSGRADGTGGMGIPFIKNTIANYNGRFLIRSGKSIVDCSDSIKSTEFKNHFPGTQSVLVIN